MIKNGYYYQKVYVQQTSIDLMIGDSEPRVDSMREVESSLFLDEVTSKLSAQKAEIVRMIAGGENWNQIAQIKGMKQSEIYKIKNQLKTELSWIKNQRQPRVRMV